MGPQDLKQIAIGFVLTLIFLSLAVMFPVYEIHTPGQSTKEYVRYPIWDPPTVSVGLGGNDEQIAELEKHFGDDPNFQAHVEKLKDGRKEIALRPNIFPNRHLDDQNSVGGFAMYFAMAYVAFVIYKFVNRG